MAIIQPINSTGGGTVPTMQPLTSSVPGSAPFVNSPVPQARASGTPTGSTFTTNQSSTTPMSGPNGAFSSLGPQLGTNAGNIMTAGQQALQTGMAGPGSDIYNTQFQQQQNQTNVNEAQRGITSSPYGAGVANQADIAFNQNWRNSQLSMDQAGINAATSAMAPATGLYNQSYGSTTAGYNSSPPPPADPPLNIPTDSSGTSSSAGQQQQPGAPQYNSSNVGGYPAPAVPYSSPVAPQRATQGPMQGPALPGPNGTPGQIYPQGPMQGPAIPGQTPGNYTDPTTGQTTQGSGQVQGPMPNGQPIAGPSTGGPVYLPDPSQGGNPQDIINSVPDVPTDSNPSIIDNVMNWLSSINPFSSTPTDTNGGASGDYSAPVDNSGGSDGSW